MPAEPPGERRTGDVAGVVRHLVAPELPVETLPTHDAERHAAAAGASTAPLTAATTCDAATAG